MPFEMSIDTKDLRDLERNLQKAGEAGRKASLRGRIRGAQKIAAAAKRNAPVRTGRLRNSIHEEWEDSGPVAGRLITATVGDSGASRDPVSVETNVAYATRQEFEHKTKAGYMRRAVARHYKDVVNEVEKELKKVTR